MRTLIHLEIYFLILQLLVKESLHHLQYYEKLSNPKLISQRERERERLLKSLHDFMILFFHSLLFFRISTYLEVFQYSRRRIVSLVILCASPREIVAGMPNAHLGTRETGYRARTASNLALRESEESDPESEELKALPAIGARNAIERE